MKNPFFPRSKSVLAIWATNYQEKIAIHATALGLTPAEVTAEIALCQSIIDAINAANTQKNLYKAALETRDTTINTQGGELRFEIARHKMASGYNTTIGQDLGIIGADSVFDPTTFKPVIRGELSGGKVLIRFKKTNTDGINIYRRQKGTSTFTFLSRATKSPFEYQPVLSEPNKPEHWEYRAFGVIDDVEIGLASDIIEIVYGE
ncbi:hypothetical protein [Flavobacterium sp. UBA7682]|uniref:hypothetical protein n=1 Tax=Flavobacterium sp. UBA7682 TaxID=1946560 RepID=UPI0025C5D011|nr:hypothetical protein [Flavobacterium sp. UBA7682]